MKQVAQGGTRRNSALPIHAELIGSDTCTAVGLTARSATPTLALCRQMLAAGLDPDQAIEVYRNGTLALRIRSIGEAAKLAIRDDNRGVPRLVSYRPGPDERAAVACGGVSPMRQTASAVGACHG